MQLRWLARRHEEIVSKERDLQQFQVLQQWEQRRAHAEEESLRGQEATRFTSVLERRVEMPPMPADEQPVVDVSKPVAPRAPEEPQEKRNLDLERLRLFRRLNPHVFGEVPEPLAEEEKPSLYPSLSPYDAFKGPDPPISQFKARSQEELALQNVCARWGEKHAAGPETGGGTEHLTPTLEAMRRQQLEEVEQVKRAFGSYGVPCNAAALERALVMPPQQQRPDVGIGGFVPRLLVNPFFDHDAGSKKKKKGKRKTRR
jgi:hypothetical protein